MTSWRLDDERVFQLARRLPDEESKREYLDQVCAGDQALRERVEALLEAHEKEESLLQSNDAVAATEDLSPITETTGTQIGRYKLLQNIGEGGFGVVYMAEQARPVRRKVALKIIKPGMDTRSVVARFEAERQALALMDHPNIARVLDGGATDSGRPYFVMELVRGVPITEYCDKNQLSTRDRLDLFTTVCQAVQHAHQKGIIHRDLKPSNILVTLHDGKPVVKVIDFGVAKATNQQLTEKTLFTAYGQMVGTPQYMSPEQAEMSGLDVDTRSDVYSLGVLLYELLTGTTPLESERLKTAGYAEMQRLIREEEPPKPSTRLSTSGENLTVIAKHRSVSPEGLRKAVRGDLDWIVMKALEKDRGRRYDSPSDLVGDVSRFLSNEAVEARPPTLAYRTQKYLKRNLVPISLTTIVVSTLAAGLAGTLSQWNRAEHKAEEAFRAQASAKESQAKAEAALSELREAVIERAKEAILNADFESAKRLLDDVKDGELDLRFTLKGVVMVYEGQYPEAIATLTKALQEDERDVAALSMLSVAEHLSGYWMEARRHRQIAFSMGPRVEHEDLDQLCIAQAQILDNRGIETEAMLQLLHSEKTKPLVSVVLAHALAHRAFEYSAGEDGWEEVQQSLEDAKRMVSGAANVTQGFHFLDLITLFVAVMDMHIRKLEDDPEWRQGTPEADEVAKRLMEGQPCQTAYMLVAEYYRLTRSIEEVERAYETLADHDWARFKLACLRASRGEEVDWAELQDSEAEDDYLAAIALSSDLELPEFSAKNLRYSPLTAVGVLLARQQFDEAKSLAKDLIENIDSFPSSETEREFETLCLQNLVSENALDEDLWEATDWPLQAKYRLGLKYFAQKNYPVAAKYFDEVIDSLHPEVYFNERAHWAMVLRRRIDEESNMVID